VHRYRRRAPAIVHTRECQRAVQHEFARRAKFTDAHERRDWLARARHQGWQFTGEASHFLRNVVVAGSAVTHPARSLHEPGIIDRRSAPRRTKYLDAEHRMQRRRAQISEIDFELDLVLWSMKTGGDTK